jgi:uncharacterized protein (TIGR04255 family)
LPRLFWKEDRDFLVTSEGATPMIEFKSPEFERPPVVEVALATYFQPLPGLRSTHLNGLRDLWGAEYPSVEELPEAPPIPADVIGPQRPEIKFEVVSMPTPRYLFKSTDERQLIQVQRDRIVHNWRQLEVEDEYPRYANLLPRFERAFDQFVDYIDAADIGPVRPLKAEVLYLNLVEDQERVLAPWSGDFTDSFLGEAKYVASEMRFVIKDSDARERGLLYVQAGPAIHQPTGDPRFILQLMARGDVTPSSRSGVVEFLNLGHDWVVNGFVSATKSEMHTAWGKQ